MRARSLLVLLLLAAWPAPSHAATPADLVLSELVADPQQDWDGDGRISGNDEYVEILNSGVDTVSIAGWTLLFNDTTPATAGLGGTLEGGGRLVVANPPGDINNNGHVALRDANGRTVSELRFGTWIGSGSTPSADASSVLDEALVLVGGAWRRMHATPGEANDRPQVRARVDWSPTPIRGWVAAGAWGLWNVTVVHAGQRILDAALLDGSETVLGTVVAQPPSGRLDGTLQARAPSHDLALHWRIRLDASDHVGWNASWRIDAEAPTLPMLPSQVWTNQTPGAWTPPGASDGGVGGVEWQWDVGGSAGAWSAEANVTWAGPKNASLRARVRDAFGHTSPWSAEITTAYDAVAPDVSAGLEVTGDGPFELRWPPPADNGSGVAQVEIRRWHAAGERTWTPARNASSLADPFTPTSGPLRYGLRATDAAGNVADWTVVDVDYASLHPRVNGIRVQRPYWSSGTQEVRVDFDRDMDPGRPPQVFVDGQSVGGGRFLSNRSTYLWTSDASGSWADGVHVFEVREAYAGDGGALRGPATASWTVDRTLPTVQVFPLGGWTNARSVDVDVDDESPGTRLLWRVWPEGASMPSWQEHAGPFQADLGVGNWSFRAGAIDPAGNRAREVRGVLRIDRTPPSVGNATFAAGSWTVPVTDGGAGVDWSGLGVAPGWRARAEPRHERVVLDPWAAAPGDAVLDLVDLAGNMVQVRLPGPPPAPPAAEPSASLVPLNLSEQLAHLMGSSHHASVQRSEGGVWWAAAGTVVGIAALGGSAWTVWRRREAQRLLSSFGARIRRLRLLRARP